MKKVFLLSAFCLAALSASAQEVAAVVASVPIVQQVAVPRQVCENQPVVVDQPTSGAGTVIGAIAGGILGHTVGGGSGKTAATAVGAVAGAVVGDRLEAGNNRQTQMAPRCVMQSVYENRTVGYNVTYEYAGRQYQTRMANDPGPSIRLQVMPVMESTPAAPPTAAMPYGRIDISDAPPPVVVSSQPVVVTPATVAMQEPIYLYVPVAQQQNWGRYCGHYNACGQPVYFVQEQWVRDHYREHENERRPRYRDDHDHDHGRDHGHGHRGEDND